MMSSLSILQLVLAMDGAGGQEDVNSRLFGMLQGLPGAVDVGVAAAGQAADHRAADVSGDLADGLEIALRGDRKAGLDDIDAQIDQGLGDFHLFGQVHARPGRLLAVAERGVENYNLSGCCIGHDFLVSCHFWREHEWSIVVVRRPTLGRPEQHQPCPRGQ